MLFISQSQLINVKEVHEETNVEKVNEFLKSGWKLLAPPIINSENKCVYALVKV